jgi:eukaryotic-like serine/threonine-protein kinase
MSNQSGEQAATLPKTLFGYEVLDYIGQGAGSMVYVVSDPKTKQLFAMKHVVRKVDKDERFVEQLEAEYEVGRHVVHPTLRKSLELKINKTLLRKTIDAALIMELFDGRPLEAARPTSLRQTVDIFIKTGHALEGLHKAGFVHCDLKPNNIMFGALGEVKVIDLGQTCKIGTVKSRIQGTPDYISPEQVKCEAVSPKTDVYNFGATLFWCLTGKNLPTLFTLKKGDNSILSDDLLETPAQLNPRCPEQLSNLVMECVRVRPEKRPEMADIVRRLDVMLYALQKIAAQNAATRTNALTGSGSMAAAV